MEIRRSGTLALKLTNNRVEIFANGFGAGSTKFSGCIAVPWGIARH